MLKLVMIINRKRELVIKMRPRKLTPLEEQGVYQAHKEKRPLAEIAYKYGISVPTVLRIVKRVEKGDINNGIK